MNIKKAITKLKRAFEKPTVGSTARITMPTIELNELVIAQYYNTQGVSLRSNTFCRVEKSGILSCTVRVKDLLLVVPTKSLRW